MAKALKGKILKAWIINLPNEDVAKEFLKGLNGNFEFIPTKSSQNRPLKLIQLVISFG